MAAGAGKSDMTCLSMGADKLKGAGWEEGLPNKRGRTRKGMPKIQIEGDTPLNHRLQEEKENCFGNSK